MGVYGWGGGVGEVREGCYGQEGGGGISITDAALE